MRDSTPPPTDGMYPVLKRPFVIVLLTGGMALLAGAALVNPANFGLPSPLALPALGYRFTVGLPEQAAHLGLLRLPAGGFLLPPCNQFSLVL